MALADRIHKGHCLMNLVEGKSGIVLEIMQKPVEAAKMTLEQPAGEMWQKIREELNENKDTRDADLAHIKEWLKQEPHLPDEFDDQRIMTFLRGCKFSLEKTKRKLDMYFTMRTAVPEFFNDRDVTRPELQEILNMVQMPPLPGLTPEGRPDAFKLALMMGDLRLAEEKEGVAGDVYVLDASVATPTHFAKFTPTLVKKFLVCVQEAYPVKLKEVHVINVSPSSSTLIAMIFINTFLRKCCLQNAWVKKMEEYTPWFKEQEDLKANEALRPGKPTNYDELFGIDGSFRQLGELWEQIRIELNENIHTREKDLSAIKDWLRKQPHLPNEWEDDCLLTFLRGCNFSLEKTKRKLDMYFTMRNACPEFFANRDITRPELRDLTIRAQGPTLPGLTPNGRRVSICRALDKSLTPHQLNDAFKLAMMIGDVRLKEETEGVAGDVYILDASIIAPSHLGKISPSTLKKFMICLNKTLPQGKDQEQSEVWKSIRVELKEDVTTRDRDVAAIKEWLKKQPHLPDDWETAPILTFLRGSSFSMEKCKRKLDMYFTMRAACPEFFTNRDATRPDLNEIMANKIQGPPLPGVTPNGRRVTICRGIHPNMDAQQIVDTLKLALMIGDVRLTEEKEGVAGDIYVLDAAILGPSMLTKLSATTIKKFMICVQEAYPIKLKEVHIINTSPIVERFINFQWKYKLQEYREWFKRQDSIIANETLRPGKPCNYDELFGIDGSFRQLAID
ncbi:Cellular retinaldehyde-binding protein [Operophtera brumata]|uniref:Cellular retinaldehyde-binding protein n=1 Tax=Operophtera brumata TaxID=104452 RepID=A0A0L7LLC8_OPEBR|nr:Cellular retinaldehyde-binding protein [Operophtera brumata]